MKVLHESVQTDAKLNYKLTSNLPLHQTLFFFSFSVKNEVRTACYWRQADLSVFPSFFPPV